MASVFSNGIFNSTSAIRLKTPFGNSSARPPIQPANTLSSFVVHGAGASNNTGDDGFLQLSAGGGTNTNTMSYIQVSGYSGLASGDMNNNIVFGTAGTEKMRLDIDGNLQIASNAPNGGRGLILQNLETTSSNAFLSMNTGNGSYAMYATTSNGGPSGSGLTPSTFQIYSYYPNANPVLTINPSGDMTIPGSLNLSNNSAKLSLFNGKTQFRTNNTYNGCYLQLDNSGPTFNITDISASTIYATFGSTLAYIRQSTNNSWASLQIQNKGTTSTASQLVLDTPTGSYALYATSAQGTPGDLGSSTYPIASTFQIYSYFGTSTNNVLTIYPTGDVFIPGNLRTGGVITTSTLNVLYNGILTTSQNYLITDLINLSGNKNITGNVNVGIKAIGGGGGGGGSYDTTIGSNKYIYGGGGGGSGQEVQDRFILSVNTTLTIQVGDGGTAGTASNGGSFQATKGTNGGYTNITSSDNSVKMSAAGGIGGGNNDTLSETADYGGSGYYGGGVGGALLDSASNIGGISAVCNPIRKGAERTIGKNNITGIYYLNSGAGDGPTSIYGGGDGGIGYWLFTQYSGVAGAAGGGGGGTSLGSGGDGANINSNNLPPIISTPISGINGGGGGGGGITYTVSGANYTRTNGANGGKGCVQIQIWA